MITKKREFVLSVGNAYWPVFKTSESVGNLYLIPRIPLGGLHFSLHAPNEMHSEYHAHLKSDKLRIHEDIKLDDRMFSKDYWCSRVPLLVDMMESGLNPNLSEDQIMVFPPGFFDMSQWDGPRQVLDVTSFFSGMFYLTQERRMPMLLQKFRKTYPERDIYGNTFGIAAPRNGSIRAIISIDAQKIFEFHLLDALQLFDLEAMRNAFGDAMKRAIKRLEEQRVDGSIGSIPVDFIETLKGYVKTSRPKIINF